MKLQYTQNKWKFKESFIQLQKLLDYFYFKEKLIKTFCIVFSELYVFNLSSTKQMDLSFVVSIREKQIFVKINVYLGRTIQRSYR